MCTRKCYSLSGWGYSSSTSDVPDYLQQSQVPIVDYARCKKANGWLLHDKPMVCIGAVGSSACNGDSGGPLVCEEGGRWVIRGAASFVSSGDVKCDVKLPSIFARVSTYVNWIKKHTGVPYIKYLALPWTGFESFKG